MLSPNDESAASSSWNSPIRHRDRHREHAEPAGAQSLFAGPLRILAIEDDADTRENLCDILELDGHRVEAAACMREALARDDWSELSAILLDRRLPEGNADGLLPRLRQLAPEAAVVVITGYADLESALSALREGASDYILKPVNPDALRASLARIARIKQAERQALQAERLAAIGQVLTMLALEMLGWELAGKSDLLLLVREALGAQKRVHRLFEDVRCYAAPIQLKREPVDLEGIVEEVWSSLRERRTGRRTRWLHARIRWKSSCSRRRSTSTAAPRFRSGSATTVPVSRPSTGSAFSNRSSRPSRTARDWDWSSASRSSKPTAGVSSSAGSPAPSS
jgi:FixJ family two-component response regulator